MELSRAGMASEAATAQEAALWPGLSLGERANAEQSAVFDRQLADQGLNDGHAVTRHFIDASLDTRARFGGTLNQHITPLNGREARFVASSSLPDGSLSVAPDALVLPRDVLEHHDATQVFAPDSGTVTPQGRHLTEAGEQNVIGQHAVDRTTAPETIADMQRVPLDQVNRVLAQHARQEAQTGEAPARRAATPEGFRPRANEVGRLTLRSWRHDAAQGDANSATDQHYKSLMAIGQGKARHVSHLGQREMVDQSLNGGSGTQIGLKTGFHPKTVNYLLKAQGLGSLKAQGLGSAASYNLFTRDERHAGAMRILYGGESQRDVARSGHADKSVARITVSRWVTDFNKLPSNEQEKKRLEFERSRQETSWSGAGPSAASDPFPSTPADFNMGLPYNPSRAPSPADAGSDEEHEEAASSEVQGVTTPTGTFVPQHEIDYAKALLAKGAGTRDETGTPTAFGLAIGKRGTSASDPNLEQALGREMVQANIPQGYITHRLDIGDHVTAALKRDVEAARQAPEAEPSAASPSDYGDSDSPGPSVTSTAGPSRIAFGTTPDVAVASMEAAQARSWNAGDRFQVIGEAGGPPQHVVVLKDHVGGFQFLPGDIQRRIVGG